MHAIRKMTLAVLGLALLLNPVRAAEPADTQAVIDAQISAWESSIVAQQDAYAASHGGSFCQLLRTHTAIPTTLTAPNNLDAQPPSADANWRDFGLSESEDMRGQWKVTVYTSGGQKGWQLTADTMIGGVQYQRALGYGPQAATRTYAWKTIP